MNLQHIDPMMIAPDPDNVRVWGANAEADAGLLASVQALGIIQPIVVRPAPVSIMTDRAVQFVAIAGNRRLMAAQKAQLRTIPCDVRGELGEGEVTAIQLAENTVRADMTPVDVWLGVNRLARQGWAEEAIGLAFNLTTQRVRQLVKMGSLPEQVVQVIRETGDLPRTDELRVICQAPQEVLLATWKRHVTAGHRAGKWSIPWWQVANDCRITRIPYERAIFDVTDEVKAALGWERDLFDPADHPGYFHDVPAFLAKQKDAAEAKLAEAKKGGLEVMVRAGEDASGTPPGCTWETKALGAWRSMKKAERANWVGVARIWPDGRAELDLWKRKAAAKPATPQDGAGGGSTRTVGRADGRDTEAGMLTEKGMQLVELAKRQAVTAGLAGLGSHDLLLIALILLREKLGSTAPAMNKLLLGGNGAIDCNTDDRIARINGAAVELLGSAIGRPAPNRYSQTDVPLALVERIGMGLCVEPRLTLDRDGLDQLKRDALAAVRKARNLPDFQTQKALRNHMVKMLGTPTGEVVLTSAELPVLACGTTVPLPYGWRYGTAEIEDEGEADELAEGGPAPQWTGTLGGEGEDDARALASAGLGTDEDYAPGEGLEEAA